MRQTLFVLLMSAAVVTRTQSTGKVGLVLPGTQSVFAISPAPDQDAVALYSAANSDSDEGSGALTLVANVSGRWQVRQFPEVAGSQSNSAIAWYKDVVYAGTDDGIFMLRPGGKPEKIYSGEADGLAISPDGSHAAFWRSEDDNLVLTDLRLSDRSVVKSWTLPQNYAGDSYGFDLAFTSHGTSILARTYDEINETPLKEFSLEAEKAVTLIDECQGLAQQGDHIFVLGKRRASDKSTLLFQFSGGSVQQISGPAYDAGKRLVESARSGLVILTDKTTHEVLVRNMTRAVSDKTAGCEDATSLTSGQLLFFRGARIFFDPSGCSAP